MIVIMSSGRGVVPGRGGWGGRVVVNYYGILYNWLRLYDEGGDQSEHSAAQPSGRALDCTEQGGGC